MREMPQWFKDYLHTITQEQANELLTWIDRWRPEVVVIAMVKSVATIAERGGDKPTT